MSAHSVTVTRTPAGQPAYGVSCSCGWSTFVQGRKARERARNLARLHRENPEARYRCVQ